MLCLSCRSLRNFHFSNGWVARRLFQTGKCSQSGQGQANPAEEQSGESDETSEDAVRGRILESALGFVPQHGWSQDALAAGAESEGFPGIAHGMFSRGGADLALYFYASSNQKLADQMAKGTEDSTQSKKVHIFINDALETRLTMQIPYLDTWPQAMGLFALPSNAPLALQNLSQLCDDIWYYAGDRSTDINWYTKRVSLAAVYKSTELFMLQDKSEDFIDTWQFMNRRLGDLASFGKFAKKMQTSTGSCGELLFGGMHIARNMLGFGDRRR